MMMDAELMPCKSELGTKDDWNLVRTDLAQSTGYKDFLWRNGRGC